MNFKLKSSVKTFFNVNKEVTSIRTGFYFGRLLSLEQVFFAKTRQWCLMVGQFMLRMC